MLAKSKMLSQTTIRNYKFLKNLVHGLITVAGSQSASPNHLVKLKKHLNRQIRPPALMFSTDGIPIVDYTEIEELPNHPEKLLIDVRDADEVKFGKIPQSINIPLSNLTKELAMDVSDDKFQKKYGRPKPKADTYIIMYCRSGSRSCVAAEAVAALGYSNVHNYAGSWLDYVKNKMQK